MKVDGVQTTTPRTVTLKRDRSYTAVYEKEGHPPRQTRIESRASWWLLGNVIFGGLVGLVIDLAAGGAWTLEPETVEMDLATGNVKP